MNGFSEPIDGVFKGRGRRYLPLLACPIDGAPLEPDYGGVICTADPAHGFRFEDGILRLADPGRRADLDRLSEAHEAHGARQGWKVPDEDAFKSLPQTALSGYAEGYWEQVAAGTALLWRFLEAIRHQNGALPVGPVGEAAVLGAGMGWLAYALDVAGYTTLAIDAYAGPRYGLGAYPIARYLRVQADPAQPPLAAESLDLVLFQEGLARADAPDAQQAALETAIAALRPGAWLVVMDAFAESADAVEAMRARMEAAGLRLMNKPQRPGWRGRLAAFVERSFGRDEAPPPVTVAQKPDPAAE